MAEETNIDSTPTEDEFIVPSQVEEQNKPAGVEKSDKSTDADEKSDESTADVEKSDESTPVDEKSDETSLDKNAAHQAYLARQARREAREAKEQLEGFRQELTEIRKASTKTITTEEGPPQPPHPDKFEFGIDDDRFIEAQQKYLADRDTYILNQAEEKAFQRFQEAQEKVSVGERAAKLQTRVSEIQKKGLDKYSDFDDVVEDAFAAMQPDVGALQSLAMQDAAEDVVYHLAKNPAVLERITALEPMAQAFEMGQLASQFAAKRNSAKTTVTKATATPTQTRGASGQFANSEDAMYERLLKRSR